MKSITYDDEKWQLVPKEPTRVMLDEAHCDLDRSGEIDPMVKLVYMNMLYKAPQPPVVEVEPVAVVDASDDGYFAEILPDRDVKIGQLLYPAHPDTEALRQQLAATTAPKESK